MKKLNILITTLLLISVLFSCKRVNKCDEPTYWEVDSIEKFEIAKLKEIATCTEKYLFNETLNQADTCKSCFFVINTSFSVKLFSGRTYCGKDIIDTIENIEITSTNNYSEDYKKGEILNDIFDIFIYNENTDSINCPVKLNQFLNSKSASPGYFHLLLNEIPDSTRLHEFTVKIELQDTTFINKTLPIYIKQ
ncbi:MAG: hypothetical protein L3J35_00885 [Bacteroidales bacterium]|nr:hypothetical protein [Bacteroidales bacterium]